MTAACMCPEPDLAATNDGHPYCKRCGRWYILRLRPEPSTPPKVGRNDPCPCGSGKKSKLCCMK